MSNKLQELAWEVDLPLSRKIVLVSLADQSNDVGESWPGLETIRKRCSIALRTLYEAIAELEADGWLEREPLPGYKTLYRVNVQKLRQQELLPTPAPRAPLRQPHPCATRTPAGNRSRTPAVGAPIKATIKSKATEVCISAGASDFEGRLEGHEDPKPAMPGNRAAGELAVLLRERGFRTTSQDPRILEAVAVGVPLTLVAEFVDLYPASHPNCRGSPGYVLSAAVRQHTTPIHQDRSHAAGPGPRRNESAAERVRRVAVEAEHRDRAAAHGDAHALDAHG